MPSVVEIVDEAMGLAPPVDTREDSDVETEVAPRNPPMVRRPLEFYERDEKQRSKDEAMCKGRACVLCEADDEVEGIAEMLAIYPRERHRVTRKTLFQTIANYYNNTVRRKNLDVGIELKPIDVAMVRRHYLSKDHMRDPGCELQDDLNIMSNLQAELLKYCMFKQRIGDPEHVEVDRLGFDTLFKLMDRKRSIRDELRRVYGIGLGRGGGTNGASKRNR